MIIKRYGIIYLINAIAIALYAFVMSQFNFEISDEVMFSTMDAEAYRDVAFWIGSGTETIHTFLRPCFYPLLLLITYGSVGFKGVWIMQFLFWLASVNFTFLSLWKITRSMFLTVLGTLCLLINLSLVTLTVHALTEVTVTFFLASLVYYVVSNLKKSNSYSFLLVVLGFTSILAVIKPLFVYFIPIILLVSILFNFKRVFGYHVLKRVLGLVLVVSPVLFQMAIMKVKHDTFKVSDIGRETFTYYLLAAGVEEIEEVKREESRDIAGAFSSDEKWDYISNHKNIYLQIYGKNLQENINGNPYYLSFPVGQETWNLYRFMKSVNLSYYYMHIVFSLLTLIALIKTIRQREFHYLWLLVFLSFVSYSILLTSGLSFWQGDRLVIPAQVVWIPLYLLTIHILVKKNIRLN